MRKVALATSEPSTETDSVDDIAEHSPTGLLAQHLRTTRYHIAQAIVAMREVVTLADGNEGWATHLEQLGRIAGFVEGRCALFDMGQRSFLLPDQVQHFATLLQKRRESAHLSRVELGKRAGLSSIERSRTSSTRRLLHRAIRLCDCWT
jgi:hypothetical protein